MQIPESDHLKLQLEHAKLKLTLLETQMQLIQSNHALVRQEIDKFETEMAVLEDHEPKESHAD